MISRQQLIDQIKQKKSFLCVGLDTDIDKIPEFLKSYPDPIFEFNKRIIDATQDLCVSYKPNAAFYEARGVKGLQSLIATWKYLPKNCLSIIDAKRGDIGNTSDKYAKAFFDEQSSEMSFDARTGDALAVLEAAEFAGPTADDASIRVRVHAETRVRALR